MTALIVLAIVLVLIVLVVVGIRMFNIEFVKVPAQQVDEIVPVDDEAEAEDPGEGGEDGEEPAEMVDLFDYFESKEDEDESVATVERTGDGLTDKLTEFKSGRGYLVDCKKMLETAKNDNLIYCSVYIDFDRFSYINNLKGAATGDYVLTQTSQQIRRIFPEGALFTRFSCDHFAGVFPLADMALFEDYYEQLRRMCDKIRSDIAAKTGLRISVGFAMTDNDSSYDVSVLVARANVARHCSKVTKSEKYEIYDETMITSNFYGESMLDNYNECQYGDEFVIYFETQVDIFMDKIVGCDTLVRWVQDDKSNDIITQDSGRIPTNNNKVVYHVCRAMSRWRKAGREVVSVFVELPVTEIFKSDVDEFLSKCLTEFQIDPASLVIKVDVSVVRLAWSTCSKQFKKIRDIGVKVCISGMDTGYANLDFLSGLSVDYVKLHRSFVYNVESNREQLERCRKIAERVTQIGAQVIFEGVDNMDQMTVLRSISVKTVQGRYTGRASSADDLVRNLPEHVERRVSSQTVILDEVQLAKGDWHLF